MPTGLDAIWYASANAGVRALYAQLLDDAMWQRLLTAENVSRVTAALEDTAYAASVTESESEAETPSLFLQRLELRLTGRAAQRVHETMMFARDADRQLLLVWWRHFELENLKSVFRGVAHGLPPETIERFLVPLGSESRLPWDSLVHERTLSGVVERTQGTHYITPLRNALPTAEREGTIFPVEVALDIRYYRDLDAAIGRLSGDAYRDARKLLGAHVDILNILWAYRYRIYYNLSPEEIVNYTLWHGIRTDTGTIRRIALGANPQDIVSEIWGPGAVDLSSLAQLNEYEMLPELEGILLAHWRKLARRAMSGYPFKLGTLLGYLILQQLEVQDLITLVEGKAMGWTAERIESHMIRSRE